MGAVGFATIRAPPELSGEDKPYPAKFLADTLATTSSFTFRANVRGSMR